MTDEDERHEMRISDHYSGYSVWLCRKPESGTWHLVPGDVFTPFVDFLDSENKIPLKLARIMWRRFNGVCDDHKEFPS